MIRFSSMIFTVVISATAPLSAQPQTAPVYGGAFWEHWGDGHAEIAAYELVIPRYGTPRRGTAVAIFVTENFSNSMRVKAESSDHPRGDVFPVIKLNLVQDFQTGIYDYNTMTSVFAALEAINGRPAGHITKVSFGSQEWCGHVYQQLRLDRRQVRHDLHSYFDGEADRNETLPHPADGLPADALPLWARGLAGPALRPGQQADVRLLSTLQHARLTHQQLAWRPAMLKRAAQSTNVTISEGTFAAELLTVNDSGGPDWKFYVEPVAPRRLLKWERSDGLSATLLGSRRMKYWQLNGEGKEALLAELGLPLPK